MSSSKLRRIHAECHSQIRWAPICPLHGEVGSDEIVHGYEIARGQFAFVEPIMDQIRELRMECSDRREYERRLAVMMDLYLGGEHAVEALKECLKDGPLQGCSG